jgi:hypothetical protein
MFYFVFASLKFCSCTVSKTCPINPVPVHDWNREPQGDNKKSLNALSEIFIVTLCPLPFEWKWRTEAWRSERKRWEIQAQQLNFYHSLTLAFSTLCPPFLVYKNGPFSFE